MIMPFADQRTLNLIIWQVLLLLFLNLKINMISLLQSRFIDRQVRQICISQLNQKQLKIENKK